MKARAKRGWRFARRALGATVVVLLALLVVLLSVLDTAPVRERIRQATNSALAASLSGRVEVQRIGHLGLFELAGVDARVWDVAGHPVLSASGVRVEYSLPRLLWGLLGNDGVHLELDAVRCDHAEVLLLDAPEGVSLAGALQPKPSPEPSEPGSEVTLRIAHIGLGHAWVYGRLAGAPPIDVELARLEALLSKDARRTQLNIEGVEVLARALPFELDPSGRLRGALELPSEPEEPLYAQLDYYGSLLDSAASLTASLEGDRLDALLDLGPVTSESVQRRFPGAAVRGDSSLSAQVGGTLKRLRALVQLQNPAARVDADVTAVLDERLNLSAEVDASNLDLAGLLDGAPPSELALKLRASLLEQSEGRWLCEHRLGVAAGQIAGQPTPEVRATGFVRFRDEQLEAEGKLLAEESGLDLDVEYTVRRKGPLRAELSLTAALDDPERLRARGVLVSGTLQAEGRYAEAEDVVAASARADLARLAFGKVRVNSLRLSSELRGTTNAPQLATELDVAVAEGRVHARAHVSAREQRLQLSARALSVDRLRAMLAPDAVPAHGRLDVEADLRRVGERISGRARVDVPELRVDKLGQGYVHVVVSADGTTLDGDARVAWGKLGSVTLTAEGLPFSAAQPERLAGLANEQTFRGQLRLNGRVDLGALEPSWLTAVPQVERLRGRVAFDVAALRPTDAALELISSVDTSGLQIVQKREPRREIEDTEEAIENAPLALEGVDLHLRAAASLPDGGVVTTLVLADQLGSLLRAQGKTTVSEEVRQHPERLSELPFELHLEIPRRRVSQLPTLVRPAWVDGWLSARAGISGSARRPTLTTRASLRGLRVEQNDERVDLGLEARYEPSGGRLEVKASDRGRTVGRLWTEWLGDLRELAERASGVSPVTADLKLELSRFPTGAVPMLKERHIEGELSGAVSLLGWGKAPRLEAQLHSRTLSVANVRLSELAVSVANPGERLEADACVRIGQQETVLSFESALPWGAQPLPTFERDLRAQLRSRDFQLATLRPLVGGEVSELAGKLNADASVRLEPGTTELRGTFRVDDGILQVPSIGQRFSDISARAVVDNQRFQLQSLSARGITGRVTATASADFVDAELRAAKASLAIAEREKVPLTLEGQAVGDAWGNVEVRYRGQPGRSPELEVDVRRLVLLTPETGGHGLQTLDDAPHIRVGTRTKDGEFAALPIQRLPTRESDEGSAEESPPLRIAVRLGHVRVERGNTATARMRGQLDIVQAEEARVTGRIELTGGQIDVQGKTFEIEQGVITFDGADSSNPTITATARWDSPTDHVVYAEYVGDVENGRIKLRSEPPLTDDEIASLLLFGNTDGTVGQSGGDQSALAVSVAGSTVSKGLNQVLSDFTTLDVSTRIDTSTGSSRPEVVIQVTPRLAAKVTRAMGEPTAGESPDRTFLTLELRLQRAWALSALVGDRGASALDLIWRRRY